MNTDNVDFPMPEEYNSLLSEIIGKAKDEKTLTGRWQFFVSGNVSVTVGTTRIDLPSIQGNPFFSFDSLGLMDIFGEKSQSFVLLPLAFDWDRFQKMNKTQKFFARFPNSIKDFMIAISFILSLALTIITILESIK